MAQALTYIRGPKAKCWKFRYANFPDKMKDLLTARKDSFEYLIAGEDENKHQKRKWLNGYMIFKCQKRLHQVEDVLNVEHRDERLTIEVAKKSFHQSRRYCMRTCKYFEIGTDERLATLSDNQQQKATVSPVLELLERRKQGATEEAMLEEFGGFWLETHHKIDASIKRDRQELAQIKMQEKFEKLELRNWQFAVMNLIRAQGPRKITFVVDEKGNSGKTYLGKYIMATKQTLYLTSSAMKDVAYAWQGERYVVFDFTRETSERINYSTIEAIKNGVIFSNKYSSKTKTHTIPVVVCFMNKRPLAKKFSNDRYQIVMLEHSDDITDNEVKWKVENWQYADFDEVTK